MVRRLAQPYDPLVEALESIMAAKKQRQYEQQLGKVSPILARGGGGANIRDALASIQGEKRPTGLGGILDRLNPASPRRGGGSEIEQLLLAELMKERGTPRGIRESLPRFRGPTAGGGGAPGTVGSAAVEQPTPTGPQLTDPTMKDPMRSRRTVKVETDMSRMADIIENLWNDPRLGSDKRMLQDLIKAGNDAYGRIAAARKNKEQVRATYAGSLDVQDVRKIEEADWDYSSAVADYKGVRGTRLEGIGEMANWAEQRLKKILASEKEGGMPSLDKMMSQAGQMLGEEEPSQGSLKKVGDRWALVSPAGDVLKYVPEPPPSAVKLLEQYAKGTKAAGAIEEAGTRLPPEVMDAALKPMEKELLERGGFEETEEEYTHTPYWGLGTPETRKRTVIGARPKLPPPESPIRVAAKRVAQPKIKMPPAPKEERRLVSKVKERPPKPKEYPDAKWSEEHGMWTVIKNGRLMGIK